MLTAYMNAALRHAKTEYLPEDKLFYAEIPDLPGVWATAETEAELQAELREALEGWIVLGLQMGHPIPAIDGVSLAMESVA